MKITKKIIVTIALFFYFYSLMIWNNSGNIFAQTYQWANSIGSTNDEEGRVIIVDKLGNIYITGYFEGTADFDPGVGTANLSPVGGWDIFFAKYDTGGNYLWARSIGSTTTDYGRSIAVDESGNVYITGVLGGTADFDPGVGTANIIPTGGFDFYFAKYDTDGNYQWAKNVSSTGSAYGYSIVTDYSSNIYITGYISGTADFDPGTGTANLTMVGDYDIFFAKYDSSGNYLWAKNIGSTSIDLGHIIYVDKSGNIHITGSFSGTADFDPGINTVNLPFSGGRDIFFAKYNTNGNYQWANSIASIYDDYGYAIAVDDSDNVYITGAFQGTADFDPGVGTVNLTPVGFTDVFLAKYDANGYYQWAKSIGGIGYDYGNSLTVNKFGNVFIAGSFEATADFETDIDTANLTSVGTDDIFFAKYDSGGNYLWAKSIGSTTYDYAHSIAIDDFGSVYITGDFQGTTDFDSENGTTKLTPIGSRDIFVAKYNVCNLTMYITKMDVSANEEIDGSVTISVSGGTSPYIYNWSNGSTLKSIQNLPAGTYTITVTDARSCQTIKSVAINVSTGKLNNIARSIEVNIYPNPTKNELNISIPSYVKNEVVVLTIYNLLGKKIQTTKFENVTEMKELSISTANLTAGEYLLELYIADSRFLQKFGLVK